jgi:excisionase family DNA binding protein
MITIGLDEAAKILRCSESTVQQKAAAKEIPATKIGRAWVFIPDDLFAYIRSQYGKEKTKAKKWRSQKEVKSGGLTLAYVADPELEKLLG